MNDQNKPEDTESLVLRLLPPYLPRRHIDIYITDKTNFPVQIKKARKILLDQEVVYLHSCGPSAVARAIHIALNIQSEFADGQVNIDTFTNSLKVNEDFSPASPRPRQSQIYQSALHVKLSMKSAKKEEDYMK